MKTRAHYGTVHLPMDIDLEHVTRQAVADAEVTGGRVMAPVNKATHKTAGVGEE